jgi:hypothetical protein
VGRDGDGSRPTPSRLNPNPAYNKRADHDPEIMIGALLWI